MTTSAASVDELPRRINRIGVRVEEAWRTTGFDELAFPEIAAAALREELDGYSPSGVDFIRMALRLFPLPAQDLESRFGQPPITLLVGRGFYVEALFWMNGVTTIHQHGFSGAFHVLSGASLHTTYHFDADRRVNCHVQVGALRFAASEVLQTGQTREILPGPALIHSLFHLIRPSVTIVVRTPGNPDALPQFHYVPPGVATNPFYRDPRAERAYAVLRSLGNMKDPGYLELAGELVRWRDPHLALRVAADVVSRGLADSLSLGTLMSESFGELGASLLAAGEHEVRTEGLLRLRNSLDDPNLRYFLALLINVPDVDKMVDLVSGHLKGQAPWPTMVSWLAQLMDRERGALSARTIKHAAAPLQAGDREILESIMRGLSVSGTIARLRADFGEQADGQESAIRMTYAAMKDFSVVKVFSAHWEGCSEKPHLGDPASVAQGGAA